MPKRRVAVMIGLDWPVGHHHQVFAGIQRYARECGHRECLINPYADLLFQGPGHRPGFAGIVARATPELAERARAARVPVVNVWLNSAARGLPTVVHDVAEAGRMTARHLLARGFRDFACLGFEGMASTRAQVDGFREVIAPWGYSCSECHVPQHYDHTAESWQEFQGRLAAWMAGWPPAIGVMVANDLLCRYLAEACRERHLAMPRSVALVGAGNELLVDTATTPTLSSIDYGFERIGYRAAGLLDELMDGAPEPVQPIRLAPVALVARQSSDAFVVEDEMVAKALRFITDHLHDDIDVVQVADHVATTRRTLSRRFNDSLGMTIHDAITRLRLDRVKSRLVETASALKTIARECGFRDATHLCKVFQRVEGTSPSEYRAARRVGHR
jgi:LacI family transcriptional regulator